MAGIRGQRSGREIFVTCPATTSPSAAMATGGKEDWEGLKEEEGHIGREDLQKMIRFMETYGYRVLPPSSTPHRVDGSEDKESSPHSDEEWHMTPSRHDFNTGDAHSVCVLVEADKSEDYQSSQISAVKRAKSHNECWNQNDGHRRWEHAERKLLQCLVCGK
ncbi:uncharacterized protein LOC124116743 isoform X2 [Haliotis rufescens]|uniref:uncharacterized protein LOC124116743 isoform X2 n=1 Tax=Haliotis rufescens TaxID=6454 RepID=UPI001EAFFFE3|nr:uncharacterized protein LOC124116743 isoform X2 [Haliotis rufescens]